jgi:hypothetical protein
METLPYTVAAGRTTRIGGVPSCRPLYLVAGISTTCRTVVPQRRLPVAALAQFF